MVEAHIGGMLNPRLALMGEVWLGSATSTIRSSETARPTTASGRSRCSTGSTDIVWLKGGVGFARLQIYFDEN